MQVLTIGSLGRLPRLVGRVDAVRDPPDSKVIPAVGILHHGNIEGAKPVENIDELGCEVGSERRLDGS